MVHAYNENVMATPFGAERQFENAKPAKIPFAADAKLVDPAIVVWPQ